LHALPSGTCEIHIRDDSGAGNNTGISIALTSSGTLRIYGTSSVKSDNWTGTALTTGQWYYLEFRAKYTSSTASGDVEIRIDYGSGPTVVNDIAAGQTTKGGSGTGWRFIGLGTNDYGSNVWSHSATCFDIDDLYILNPASGVNTGYLGNCKVECIYPNASGASSQFTPNQTGHSNYTEVDEATFDSDTTYVSTTGVGNRDSYKIGTMSSTPQSIFAVMTSAFARVDAGETTRTMLDSLRISGTYYDGTTSADLTSTYVAYRNVWENNPATSAAFTRSDVEGMEAGVKLVS
jgi:hypothetical protein